VGATPTTEGFGPPVHLRWTLRRKRGVRLRQSRAHRQRCGLEGCGASAELAPRVSVEESTGEVSRSCGSATFTSVRRAGPKVSGSTVSSVGAICFGRSCRWRFPASVGRRTGPRVASVTLGRRQQRQVRAWSRRKAQGSNGPVVVATRRTSNGLSVGKPLRWRLLFARTSLLASGGRGPTARGAGHAVNEPGMAR